jgi:aldose sugar dehydrogenase
VAKWIDLGLLAVASAALCSCIPPSGPKVEREAPPAKPAAQRAGMTQLYAENCANCHGDRGQGGGGGTRTLLTRELFDQKQDRRFFDAIKNGVPDAGMEAYGATMSDAQIWGLVVHIRELQGRALRAAEGSPRPVAGVYKSKHHSFKVETVVDRGLGLRVPWAIDWLHDGKMLITNRPGTLHLAVGDKLTVIEGTPAVVENGQGGLMEVAVHPDYKKNGWIYLALTDPAKAGNPRSCMTKLVRGKLSFDGGTPKWTSQQTIFEVDQSFYSTSGVHFGCRIVFDGQGHIFFGIGERGSQQYAQDLSRPNGKIYRVNEDGTIPADNPFVGPEHATQKHLGAIWSHGHRNPQGLVQDLEGRLWDTEHGPRGGDEVNLIQKGANYGWPTVAFSINYNDAPLSTPWPRPEQKITLPVFRWIPSTGACGLDVARGNSFPQWKGDLLAGGLVGENLDRLRIIKGQLVEREELIHGLGRIRDVSVGPDGMVYIALNDPDKIIRLTPVK